MEDQERPRKLPKLDHDDDSTQAVGSAMTGAAEVVGKEPEPAIENEPHDLSEFIVGKYANADESAPQQGTEEAPLKMSKNQLKKLRRHESYLAKRDMRKDQRKEKIQQKKERRQALFDEARATGGEEAVEKLRETFRSTKAKHSKSTLIPLTFVMDCGYDDLMLQKERISLASQLTRSYSDNSRAQYHAHLMCSSFDKLLKERFDTVLWAHKNWKRIRFMPEDFTHAAELAKAQMAGPRGGSLAGPFADQPHAKPEDGEVIYLSSDSDNTLTELKPYSTYIIGALVDKNRHKAVCYKQAVAKGIKTAKLPIGQYIEMSHRSVLATNHVVEIMLRWLECRDWGEAFMKVIPQRKGGTLKGKNGQEVTEAEAEAQAEAEDDFENGNEEEDAAEQMKQIEAMEKGMEDESEVKK
jgi:tRNA (guanine9-N1)-methyltransferase